METAANLIDAPSRVVGASSRPLQAHAISDKLSPEARRRLITSTLLGTTIEFFDVYIYGLAAGLYFAHLFFANASPTIGVIASFGTLASGFLVRPIGGIIGGHFGDRYGRKKILVASMITMGTGTFVVGLLPGYAQIGPLAPILLILARLAQGLGAGAEWGGGLLMLVEHMDQERRGFWGSLTNFGIWLGISIGTLIFAGITRLPPDVQEWAWRMPFLASGALVVIGLWVRLGVAETPIFAKAEREAKATRSERLPIADLLRHQMKPTLIAICIALGAASFQIYGAFATSYAAMLHLPMTTILLFQFANGVIAMGLTVFFGWLSDKIGRRMLAIVGSVIVVPAMYMLFRSLNAADLQFVLISLIVLEIGHSMIYGPMGAFLAEMFDTRTRYTGVSLAYQIGAGAISGLGPLAASSILAAAGGPPHVYGVVGIVVVAGAFTVIGAILAPDRAGQRLPTQLL
ncbi:MULTISPECIES: MFS transporter [unclassified Bradyrhizobium]|uniref:MFS transporter n=1 Tax=unclassified Bradyrhizobium TaxID=2631580 RepID=UPI001FFA0E12|nr:MULTISPECIES: MFS transporter [unclassified Bradyrhizobium]MCK1710411.1 MFS transporter [Bradyrhizobium sp. 143]MCK1731632.1 MFS transporter [Bradyrhizobium sp. 142]